MYFTWETSHVVENAVSLTQFHFMPSLNPGFFCETWIVFFTLKDYYEGISI